MKTWSSFYPFVEPEVLGCPYPTIDHHLRLAARDFCERTSAWVEWMDPVTADGVTNTFDYELTSSQELVKVQRASLNGDDLKIMGGHGLPADWDQDAPTVDTPTLIHFDPTTFMVLPMPDEGDELLIRMVFKPALTGAGVGDAVFSQYADAIANSAKARLMMMGDKTWTNLTTAAVYAGLYNEAVDTAANSDFMRSGKTGRRTTKAPF